MFRKIREAYQNFNFQKLKRDFEVNKDRTKYYFKDFKKKAYSSGYYSKLKDLYGSVNSNLNKEQLKKKAESWENNYINKRDSYVNNLSQKFNEIKFKDKPKEGISKLSRASSSMLGMTKNFLSDTRSFVSNSYNTSRQHVGNYLKSNRQYFNNWKDSAARFGKKSGRRFFLLTTTLVFISTLGANIPNAVANYKLRKDEIERQRAVQEEISTAKEAKKEVAIKEAVKNN